jgi:two-component system OmpR family sensor kinase/two-component system sensor histidine kinase BaeS
MAVPVWVNGQMAGLVLVQTPANMQFTAAAQAFLAQINQSLLQAALIAAIAGTLLGVVIARSVSQPLSALAAAARRVAQGKLNERVPVKGSEEVANVASAFNEMTGALQRNEQLRRNMAADIAHELRTPLTVIQGNLRAILDDLYPMSKREVALVYDETITLSRLVNDLRDLSLAEAGQLSLNLVHTPIEPLIERTAQHWRELFDEEGVALQVAMADGLPLVTVDPDRLTQVLNNLLANALRHTPAQGRVMVDAMHDPSGVRVSIRDTGPGIYVADLPHVFDRFWRADESRSRESGNSGLGLAIARQYVEAMGGKIGVTSEMGAGSCFWFTLPADVNGNTIR